MFKILFALYALIFAQQLISAVIAGEAIASIVVCIVVPIVLTGLAMAGYGQDKI